MGSDRQSRDELQSLRQRVAEYERAEADWRRIERALRSSERRLAVLLSNLPGMAYRCRNDNEWTMEFVSEGCRALTGRDRSEIIGNRVVSWNDLIHPGDRSRVQEVVQGAVDDRRSFELVYRICTATSEEKWVWERGTGLLDEDGRTEYLEGFITDISERVLFERELESRVRTRTSELAEANRSLRHENAERERAEKALRESEAKYRSLVEACPDAVVMSTLSGEVLLASPQTRKLLGVSEDFELTGQNVFDFVVPEDRRRLEDNFEELLRLRIRRDTEYTARRYNGETLPVEVASSVVQDAGGKPRAVMAVIRDITERKRAQEDVEREQKTLWHMLRSSDHERQLIAYEIHDGLAQQLAAATMQFQTYAYLRESDPASARAAYEAGVKMVQQSHVEARRLISGVRPPILDESGVVAALAHLAHDQQMAANTEIEFRSDVEFSRLEHVVENALYRIGQEALANACRHSQSSKIRVSLVQRGEWIELSVRDWGVGFDPTAVDENRFGIDGMRERTRLLGGRIAVDSQRNEGTRICVELPLVRQVV